MEKILIISLCCVALLFVAAIIMTLLTTKPTKAENEKELKDYGYEQSET
jgi:hypothetical protein